MASDGSPYKLTEDDTAWDSGDDCPEVRAARNPDSRVLSAVLERPRPPTRHPSGIPPNPANAFDRTKPTLNTPLIQAIKKQLPDNVRVLLEHGANPNGYSLEVLTDYARAFLRFQLEGRRGSAGALTPSQAIPITAEEIEKRSKEICCSFWQVSGYNCHRDFYRGGDGVTALEEACKHSSTEIFEMILSASPDISYWTEAEQHIPETLGTTPSSLAVSNPLICAVKYRQMAHLRRLLDSGFNPNSMPMCRSRSYSPLMATLLCCNPPNWEAFSLLLAHPAIDRNLLTPLTRVHILHVAVSLISLEILQRLLQSGFSLSSVEPTAVGHTLLHIACLPPQITHVNIFMESIYLSACESRRLDFFMGSRYIIYDEDTPRPQPTDFFAAQKELVFFLLAQSTDPDALLAAQDCHGNTALHYLAVHRTVNWELLDSLLDSSEAAQNVYYDTKNSWGWSAENLIRHGEVSDSTEVYREFWRGKHTTRKDHHGRMMPLGREG